MVLDLRELAPPDPLLRILALLDEGGDGPHVFLLSRDPLPLYALLRAAGWRHALRHDGDGVELTVYRSVNKP